MRRELGNCVRESGLIVETSSRGREIRLIQREVDCEREYV